MKLTQRDLDIAAIKADEMVRKIVTQFDASVATTVPMPAFMRQPPQPGMPPQAAQPAAAQQMPLPQEVNYAPRI